MRQDSGAPAWDRRPRIDSGLLTTDPSEEVATRVNTQAPPRLSVISSVPLTVTGQDFALDASDEDDTAMVNEAAMSAALQRMKRWQELTATPFYVSRGAQLRFGVPVEDIGGTEPFTVVLECALKRAKAHLPAKRREWVDPYDAPAAKST